MTTYLKEMFDCDDGIIKLVFKNHFVDLIFVITSVAFFHRY